MIKVDLRQQVSLRARLRFTAVAGLSGLLVILLTATFVLEATTSPVEAAGRIPVIVIPGVAGSTFTTGPAYTFSEPDNGHGGSYQHSYGSNENVWVNGWEAALPGSDDYFDTLRIQPNGDTPAVPYSLLHVSGLYDSAYGDIIDYLHRQGYVDNVSLFTFAFDWRRDIPAATYANLDALVNQARSAAGSSQVDLVGHSMGGLVARNYISSGSAASTKVRRLISLGTPYLGSPKFLKALLYGDQFGPSFLGLGLDPGEVQDLVQNMAGGWQLLPSRAYFNFYDNANGNLLSPYREDRDVDHNGQVSGVLSYDGLGGFLRNLGKNQNAATLAQNFHDRLDPAWIAGHPRLSFINGSGMSTLGQIRDYTGSCWSWFHFVACPKTDLLTVDGDGTVPFYSATLSDPSRSLNLSGGASVHIVNREHGALVQYDKFLGIYTGDGPSLTLLGQILNNQVDPIGPGSFFALTSQVAPARPVKIGLTGYEISVTNGTEIEAYDSQGHHTGRIAGQPHKYEQNIAGSNLEIGGESQLLYLREGGNYKLRLTAGNAGSFDLKIRMLEGDTISQTVLYLNVVAGPGEVGDFSFSGLRNGGRPTALHLANTRQPVEPTAILDARASLDREAPLIKVNTPRLKPGRAQLDWEVKDGLAGVHLEQAIVDAGTATEQPVQNGQQLRLTPGTHLLQVMAEDRAGNSSVKEVSFEVPK